MDRSRRALLWIIAAPFRLIFWLISLPFRFLGWLIRPIVDKLKQNSVSRFMDEVPEDRPAADAIVDAFENPMQIMEQLEEARKHLLRALLVVVVAVVISFFFTDQLIAFLAMPNGGLQTLQAIQPTETVGVFMRVAVLAGIALATPYIAFEIWLFAAPGLMPHERRISLWAIPLAGVFFLGGMAFTYFLLLPVSLNILSNGFLAQVDTNWTVGSYTEFVSDLMFWIGIAFEFPLVAYALARVGLIDPSALLKQWRLAMVMIAIIAAAVTPTTDPGTMGLTMLPMVVLYFLGILFSYMARPRAVAG